MLNNNIHATVHKCGHVINVQKKHKLLMGDLLTHRYVMKEKRLTSEIFHQSKTYLLQHEHWIM